MIVYLITNTVNGRGYIGLTTRSIKSRLAAHLAPSNACRVLARAIQKYGRDAFAITPIAAAGDFASLKRLESAAIDLYATRAPTGYNLTNGGDGTRGYAHTDAARAAMAAAKRGRAASTETRARMSAAQRARVHSPEEGRKISETRKRLGLAPSLGACSKGGMSHRGKAKSAETIARMCAAQRARRARSKIEAEIDGQGA